MFQRIVYATDDSDHARKALNYVREIAKTRHSHVFILNAFPVISDLLGHKEYDAVASRRIAHGRKIADKATAELAEEDITVEQEVLEGPTAEAILRVADIRKADLIVLGARGRSSFKGMLLGSVSQKVIQHADCPVLVVRGQ